MRRGDIALWMMTKFAMLFFIFSLAYFMYLLGQNSERDICASQAKVISNGMAGKISQVVFSPVEDERRVYSFESAIGLGSQTGRYSVEMRLHGSGASQSFTITTDATTAQGKCRAGNSVVVGDPEITYIAPGTNDVWSSGETRQFKPSEFKDIAEKSRYMVIVKCSSKYLDPATGQPKKFLFVENCNAQDPENCIKLDGSLISDKAVCGWS